MKPQKQFLAVGKLGCSKITIEGKNCAAATGKKFNRYPNDEMILGENTQVLSLSFDNGDNTF